MEISNWSEEFRREIDLVFEYLRQERNLDFSGYSPLMVERCLKGRLDASGAPDLTGYLLKLEKNRTELDSLLNSLTVGVSEFFRDPLTFSVIDAYVLPLILRDKASSGDRSLRIWSAGCSTGEEPYSVAFLLKEMQSTEDLQTVCNIFGTDIDQRSLDRAARGEFHMERLGNVPVGIFQKYFEPAGGCWRVRPEIREMVCFSPHDLQSTREQVPGASVFGGFDMILCRNVLIYLDRKRQGMVLDRLERALRPGGFLVLGEAESLDAPVRIKFRQVFDLCRVFRKDPAHGDKGGGALWPAERY